MSDLTVSVMRLPHGAGLPLPSYQSAAAAGMDLLAAVPADAPLTLAPGRYAAVPTGLAIALPPGMEAQVPFVVTRGMRIAQLVLGQVARVYLSEVAALDETPRGTGGFGSTGAGVG
jgi:dUTP pyrophosphatase